LNDEGQCEGWQTFLRALPKSSMNFEEILSCTFGDFEE
jgi:hypothetical protein